MQVKLKVRRLRPGARLPGYQTEHAAGMDLTAELEGEIVLEPMARTAVPTGIAIEVPEGFEGQVRARSGRAINEGLAVVNAPGTIDSDYRGEVKVLVVNLGTGSITIRSGERIAQLVISPVARVMVEETGELAVSARGDGGFGHTGR